MANEVEPTDQISVYQLFQNLFSVPPHDETLAELPVNSPCGEDCAKAIYAARAFMAPPAGASRPPPAEAARRSPPGRSRRGWTSADR